MHWFLISPAECWSLTSWAVVWTLLGRWERTDWLMSPNRTFLRSGIFSRVDRPESVTNAKVQDIPNIFLKEARSDHRHQSAARALYYQRFCDMSQEFQPMASQLSKKAALPLAKIFATCRNNVSNTGPRTWTWSEPSSHVPKLTSVTRHLTCLGSDTFSQK